MAFRSSVLSILLLAITFNWSNAITITLSIGTATSVDENVSGVAIQKFMNIKYGMQPTRFEYANTMRMVATSNRICPQVAESPITASDIAEDCLTFSIFRHPSVASKSTGNIVVLFPSLTFSSGSCKNVNMALFAKNIEGVAVCVQHRLGVFGFGSFSGHSINNLALADQDLALQLIYANAKVLTGRNSNMFKITLMGAGAGAASILHRLLMVNETYTDQAILFDGSINNFFSMPRSMAEQQSSRLANSLGCTGAAIDCLKNEKNAMTIVSKQVDYTWGINWDPTTSGDMTNLPEQRIMRGDFKNVPLFLGMSTGAGYLKLLQMKGPRRLMTSSQIAMEFDTVAKFRAEINSLFSNIPPWNTRRTGDAILRSIFGTYYPSGFPKNGVEGVKAVAMAVSDSTHSVNNIALGRASAAMASNHSEAFYVLFPYPSISTIFPSMAVIPSWARPTLGSYFVYLFEPMTSAFQTMITRFIQTGHPGTINLMNGSMIPFESFSKDRPAIVSLNVDKVNASVIDSGYRSSEVNWWTVRLPDITVFPEPTTPEPEPSLAPLIAIVVGLVVVVIIGTLIGFCIHKSATKDKLLSFNTL